MKFSDYSDLAEFAGKMRCPEKLGQVNKNCETSNCMAWRYRKIEEPNDGVTYHEGWCGLAGAPFQEKGLKGL